MPRSMQTVAHDVTEFHQLLIATLRAYWMALCELKRVNTKNMKELVRKSKRVWVCSNLLSKIASSRVLHQHITACLTFLRIPIYTHRKVYLDFMKSDGDCSTNADGPDSAVDDISLDGDEDLDEVFLRWICL